MNTIALAILLVAQQLPVTIHDELLRDEAREKQRRVETLEERKARDTQRELNLRKQAERGISARLIDPYSAHFEWPYGFTFRTWAGKTGYVTCGAVNSRNRFGGYVGRIPFIVVVDEREGLKFLELPTIRDSWVTSLECRKIERSLPPADPALSS